MFRVYRVGECLEYRVGECLKNRVVECLQFKGCGVNRLYRLESV